MRKYLLGLIGTLISLIVVAPVAFAAIAFDASSTWVSSPASTTVTVPITVGNGSNMFLFALGFSTNNNVSATYNGVPMTNIGNIVGTDTRALALFVLPNPATGTHNIIFSATSSELIFQGFGSSYSGVAQTVVVDASTTVASGSLGLVYPTTLTTHIATEHGLFSESDKMVDPLTVSLLLR